MSKASYTNSGFFDIKIHTRGQTDGYINKIFSLSPRAQREREEMIQSLFFKPRD